MSLYGALFGGVSGLKAQGGKIGVVSDNIANVNTIGYKQGQAQFETLVINKSLEVAYQTGGVRGGTRLDVDRQGLILSTDAPTDVAISGDGFFVVNGQIDGSGQPLYTRAGSFRQDSTGNFVNAAGFFLQGWPLDEEGRLPGNPGNLNTISQDNLDSLVTVNIDENASQAQATTDVRIGVNLDASEDVYPGQEGLITMDSNSANNFEISADDIIVPDEYGLATTNSIYRGDQFRVTTGLGLQYDYEYGGFSIGRDITVSTNANVGDGMNDIYALTTLAAGDVQYVAGGASFDITIPNHGLITGDSITLAGFAALGATPAGELNATHTVTRIDANTLRITATTPHGAAAGPANVGGETVDTRIFTGNIFDAATASQAFLATTGTASFTTGARTFSITTTSLGTVTFTYTQSSPNALAGQFNSLNSLATAISEVNGLNARVVTGRLIVSAEDADEPITFANGDATGSATQRGIDWITELDLVDVAGGSRRFNTMNGLANIVNNDDGLTAVVEDPLAISSMEIRVDDPLDTIQFDDVGIAPFSVPNAANAFTVAAAVAGVAIDITVADTAFPTTLNVGDQIIIQNAAGLIGTGGLPGGLPNGGPWIVTSVNAGVDYTFQIPAAYNTAGVAGGAANGAGTETISILGESNQGSLLAEFGLVTSLLGTTYSPQSTGSLGPKYDSSGLVGENMASGDIEAQFSHTVRVFDSLGTGHDLRYSYIKTDDNEWAVEIYALPEDDVATSLVDGQIAVGTIQFNGDGTLRSISSGISGEIGIAWTNGAAPSAITFDFGTAGQPFGTVGATQIGLADGLRQFDTEYNVAYIEQDGNPVGNLISVSIDSDGYVNASYSNGDTQRLYKLPLADFVNPNGLEAISGNVFAESINSGTVILREANTNGVGEIAPASLEQSNVDLSEQLTDLIVAQRAYQSNTRTISTADDLLEQLNQI